MSEKVLDLSPSSSKMQRLQYSFGEYVGGFDEQTQRRHGYGVILYLSGNSYEGEWNQGNMHGSGRKKYANGDLYEGNWVEGKRQGKGKYRYHQGHVYEGEYKNDECGGVGKLVLAHGAGSYEGEWMNGVKHGKGVEYNRSNVCYQGEFQNGMRHGKGKLMEEKTVAVQNNNENDDDENNENVENRQVVIIEHETEWDEGNQISGPHVEEIVTKPHPNNKSQNRQRGPIADAKTLEALQQAGVAPEAIRALSQFSSGVERSFGALDFGVANMEKQIGSLVGTLDALMSSVGGEEDDEEEAEEKFDDMEYECDKKK